MGDRRLFVSVDLPASLADRFADVQAPFAELDGIRPTDPTQAHVTLKFLGDVPAAEIPSVAERLDQAVSTTDITEFTAEIGGLGVFPSFDYISVIWVGVRRGGTVLTRLHEAVEEAMVAAGFEPADHEFTPHLTLARMDHAGDKAAVQELVRSRDPTVGEMTVTAVALKESIRGPSGATYETSRTVPLSTPNEPSGD